MIPGIDLSHWQSDIDWAEVKRSGVKFAFIKATEFPDKKTTLYVDEKCAYNIKGAQQNGIHWGAYHFFRTHIDPVIQAQAYCETVGQFTSLPPVLDLEVAGSKGERLNTKVRQCLDEMEKLTNRKPIIYTSGGFWRSYMMYEKRVHADWARVYPLWMAQYTTLWPTPLYPWAGWDFWQYSDKGKLPGIKTHVDLNWFNGSEDELKARFLAKKSSNSNRKFAAVDETYEEELTVPDRADTKAYAFTSEESLDPNYKGDYQEPEQANFQKVSMHQRPSAGNESHTRSTAHLNTSADEMQWLRSYIIPKAVTSQS